MRLARLRTIPQLAREHGIARRTMFFRLMLLRARDRDQGKPTDWMFRSSGGTSPWRVNETALKQAHPELYECPDPHRMFVRLKEVEESTKQLRRRQNALAAHVRTLTLGASLGNLGQSETAGL